MLHPSKADLALARAIDIGPRRFGIVFDKAKPATAKVSLHGLPEIKVSDETLVALGFTAARTGNWLDKLIKQLVVDGFASEKLLEQIDEQGLAGGDSELQSIRNAARGYGQAAVAAQEMATIMRQVCRIDVGGVPQGTGFLVRPDLVMTAWHVVRPLLDNQTGEAIAGSHVSLKCVFDDHIVNEGHFPTRLPGRVLSVEEDWLVNRSKCHDNEIAGTPVDDPDELEGFWDFALIRLTGIARMGLPPVRLKQDHILKSSGQFVLIYQHPDGRPMSFDREAIKRVIGADVRFEHGVNTEGGSSGSPCFDDTYHVVGMHQAGPRNGPCVLPNNAENRGVPIKHVITALDAIPNEHSWPIPLIELSESRPGEPVFGRLETQRWVWRELGLGPEADDARKPILALEANRTQGKSFTVEILRSLLAYEEHRIETLPSGDVAQQTPEEFAAALLALLGDASGPLPEDLKDRARSAWLSHDLLPALMNRLEQARAGKHLWVAIDQIDANPIASDSEISGFLYLFYGEAAKHEWLHILLLGYATRPPSAVAALVQQEVLVEPASDAFEDYLRGKVPPGRQSAIDQVGPGLVSFAIDEAREEDSMEFLAAMQAKLGKLARHIK